MTPERPRTDTEIERFCNAVAGATLLPHEALLSEQVVAGARPTATWSIGELEQVARVFGASPQSLMLRLIDLNRGSWENFRALRGEFDVRQRSEPQETDAPIHYPLKVRDLGRRYIREVAAAYDRRDLSTSEVSEYLQVKVNKLPKLLRQMATAAMP